MTPFHITFRRDLSSPLFKILTRKHGVDCSVRTHVWLGNESFMKTLIWTHARWKILPTVIHIYIFRYQQFVGDFTRMQLLINRGLSLMPQAVYQSHDLLSV